MLEQNASARTLRDEIYWKLHRDIVAGVLAPGIKLRLEKLVSAYQIGMSPLREALTRLASESLVIAEGQRGFWVAPLSLDELEDISRVRALLETEALALSIQNGGADWVDEVTRHYAELERVERQLEHAGSTDALLRDWELCNGAFHEALVSACGSPWLLRLRRQLYEQAARYRRVSLGVSQGSRFVHDEHQAIFEATIRRNSLKACRVLEQHLQATLEEVRRALTNLK